MAMTTERPEAVTLKGDPMTLVGRALKVGDKAPDFVLKAPDMSDRTLEDYRGKVKVLSIVPSLDTSVCDTQTRTFNEKAASLDDDIVILTISVDTPMAQKRWCGQAEVDQVEVLSDFKDHKFGIEYGVRIKEVGLLARCLVVLDRDDVVQYVQLVPEVAQEPDYDAAIDAAKKAL